MAADDLQSRSAALTVDMGDTALPPGETHVDVDLGFGDLTIYVPHGVAVEIEGRATFGHVVVLGRVDEGYDSEVRVVEPGVDSLSTLVVDAEVGAGDLEVSRDWPEHGVPAAARAPRVTRVERGRGDRRRLQRHRGQPRRRSTLVRLAFAVLALAGGAGIVAYAGAWLFRRPRGGPILAETSDRRRDPSRRRGRWPCAASASDSLVWPAHALRRGRRARAAGRRRAHVRPSSSAPASSSSCWTRAGGARRCSSRAGSRSRSCSSSARSRGWRPSGTPSARRGSARRSARRWRLGCTTRCSRRSRSCSARPPIRGASPPLHAGRSASSARGSIPTPPRPGRTAWPPRSKRPRPRSRSCTASGSGASSQRRRPARRRPRADRPRGARGDGERCPPSGTRGGLDVRGDR